MREHARGVDEEDVVRALQRAGAADPHVDVSALTAGARGRARTLRRRRQGLAGVVAVLALAGPAALSQWPQERVAVQPAATAVPDAALLDTAAVQAVVEGVEPVPVSTGTATGLCRDEPYGGTSSIAAGRSAGWGSTPTVLRPTPEQVGLDVLVFEGDEAEQWFSQTEQQAGSCTVEAVETSRWTLVAADVAADVAVDEAVALFAQVQSGTNPSWRAVVAARSGQLVVRVGVTSYHSEPGGTVEQAATLARQALERASGLRAAGGAAR
ncbi:hypothetical protein GTQ99_17390 [Kineococcus sp. T13]|uniref:hypothetical protein n=1 Tax=Kineococcus vitellinus TaxID=2696565 RepID=UPI0014134215|nr:hypothetical protein [Kineococcus vitellinus]NAZ77183.1 hypothetical protein [Kineococcus vitellinus]